MNRVCNITKEQLSNFLLQGKTTREIGKELKVANTTISRYIRLYNLTYLYDKPKNPPYKLGIIDTKEKAYFLGFLIADGYINNNIIEISIAIKDKELMILFENLLQIKSRESLKFNKESRLFPKVRIQRKIDDINIYLTGNRKKERNVPILRRDLEVYLMRGIFDADGCITWGFRKDRNRIWHKVCFTSALNILIPIQKILYKIDISTTIKPKSNEDCFVLEFSNKLDVLKFYNYLYKDNTFIPLKRKFDKYNALRLELGELGETVNLDTIPSRATNHFVEGVETTGEKMDSLNNQI